MLKKEQKIKTLQGTNFRDYYYVFATTESGAMLQAKYDLKGEKWSDWTQVSIPVPNHHPHR